MGVGLLNFNNRRPSVGLMNTCTNAYGNTAHVVQSVFTFLQRKNVEVIIFIVLFAAF